MRAGSCWGLLFIRYMNEPKLFNSSEFGEVRVVMSAENEPLFCALDVAKALAYKNPAKAVIQHCKGVTVLETPTQGGIQQVKFITEPNVYRLVMKSKAPKAELFQDWVYNEVLPSIRKHGAYATPVTIDRMIADPDFAIQLLMNLKEERQKRVEAERQVVALSDKVSVMAPKAEYYDSILASPDSLVVTQIAKDYGMSPQEFNKRLCALGIQYKVNGQWVLYAKYQGEGYTDSQTGRKRNSNGSWMLTVWTQKGRLFLYTMLKEANVLPVIERYSGYQLPPVGKPRNIEPDPTDFYR